MMEDKGRIAMLDVTANKNLCSLSNLRTEASRGLARALDDLKAMIESHSAFSFKENISWNHQAAIQLILPSQEASLPFTMLNNIKVGPEL